MSEPLTAAIVRDCIYGLRHQPHISREDIASLLERDLLAALDAARTPALDELRRQVEELHRPGRSDINYRAVLALIDAALATPPEPGD